MDNDFVPIDENSFPVFFQDTANFKMSEPMQEWIAAKDSHHLTVKVEEAKSLLRQNPKTRTISPETNSYYMVSFDGSSTRKLRAVERSFKDFELFRITLLKRFPGSCPPPLPKPFALSKDTKRRVRLLQLFLQSVAEHAFYRSDDIFALFISSPGNFEKNILRFKMPQSEGVEKWKQLVNFSILPKGMDMMTEVLKIDLLKIITKMNGVYLALKFESEQRKASFAPKRTFEAFNSWLSTEQESNCLSPKTNIENEENITVVQVLESFVQKYSSISEVLEQGEDQFEFILDHIQFEMSVLHNWVEIIKGLEGGRSSNIQMDAEMVRAKKALLCIELPRLRQLRADLLTRLTRFMECMFVEGARGTLQILVQNYSETCEHEDEPLFQNSNNQNITPSTNSYLADFDVTKENEVSSINMNQVLKRTKRTNENDGNMKSKILEQSDDTHLTSSSSPSSSSSSKNFDSFWMFVIIVVSLHAFFFLYFVSIKEYKLAFSVFILTVLTYGVGYFVDFIQH